MSDLIINVPHLQTFQQRFGAFVVTVTCWLLWLYFLVPIVTLSGWLMGLRQLAKEIRWFGGYKSLMELMELYGEAVLVIVALWLCWTLLTSLRRSPPGQQPPPVGKAELCQAYAVAPADLDRCQNAQRITVHFDDHGHIVQMESAAAADETGRAQRLRQ
ncbi:poly-beta-1,6-N-acetyl-D-glucosamine biosynthesis protein PgaD, partial [Methylogaea oryzae]|uniref:poly-beta-1,6-N-acetyl-D-glucosamine biosynthesis protein PgaD n=1 Tax=Methylogaea oryzae TaxID=1295382 RepID=UPI0006CF41ED